MLALLALLAVAVAVAMVTQRRPGSVIPRMIVVVSAIPVPTRMLMGRQAMTQAVTQAVTSETQ